MDNTSSRTKSDVWKTFGVIRDGDNNIAVWYGMGHGALINKYGWVGLCLGHNNGVVWNLCVWAGGGSKNRT